MTTQLSMATRRELIQVFGDRHSRSDRSGKREILHDFVHLTVSHRQHAIRVLCREPRASRMKPGPRRGDDDEARGALTTLWEADDRICGNRLKVVVPTLIDPMTRHGHQAL
jgi:hypothetical protein